MRPSTRIPDRIFFSLAGLWFVALTLVGFSRTFYFRVLPEPLPTHQIVHGVVYSVWVVLFLMQALLISSHHVRWHMALGAGSIFLLMLMIPVGFYVVLIKTAAGNKSVDEAGFNLTGLTLGFSFAFAGLACRKRPLFHKRLMLLATMLLTSAAADRVAIVVGLDDVRLFRKLLAVVPAVALIGYDTLFQRRMLFFSFSMLALVWLQTWYVVSDFVFMHPVGEAIIRTLTSLVIW